jgi:type I restriction enzyme S subunit
VPEKLPKGWVKTTLGEIAQPSRQRVLPSEVPQMSYVGLEHIAPQTMKLIGHGSGRDVRSSGVRFSKGDVLYGKMRPYLNKVWVAEFDGLCSAEFLVFPGCEILNNHFFALRLNSEDFVAFANGQVSGERPRVDFEKLSRFSIDLPPVAEQERIVGKLDATLSKITRAETAANRARLRLSSYRAAVMEAAITGGLTRDWRETQKEKRKFKPETGEQLLQALLSIRRGKWETAELNRRRTGSKQSKDDGWKSRYPKPAKPRTENVPKLPDGWTWASLDQLLSSLRNGISQAPRETSGLRILRISAVRAMRVDLEDHRYLPSVTGDKYKAYLLQEGDLLFNRYNGSRELAGVCGRMPASKGLLVYPDKIIRGVPVMFEEDFSTFLAIAAHRGSIFKNTSTQLLVNGVFRVEISSSPPFHFLQKVKLGK